MILSKADVSSARIACNSAHLEGKMRGLLVATQDVHVKTKEKILGGTEAKRIIVYKRCDAEFVRPIKVQSAEINGRLSARLYCDGAVKINKGGILEGTLYAKSIIVEKGGIFSGEVFIGQTAPQGEKAEQQTLFGDEGLELRSA